MNIVYGLIMLERFGNPMDSKILNNGKTGLSRFNIFQLEQWLIDKQELSYWRFYIFCDEPSWEWSENP